MPTTRIRTADRRGRALARLCIVAAPLVLHALTASAEREFNSTISIGAAHTNNLTLAPPDTEESGAVYQLLPSFTFMQQSVRLFSNVQYGLQAYRYPDYHDSEVYHALDAQVRFALDPDNFFLETGAQRSQTVRDPRAPIPRSNLPVTGNRVNRDQTYLGPSFNYSLGGNTSVSGSLRRTHIAYDDDPSSSLTGLLADYDDDSANVSFDNYRNEQGFNWAVRYFGNRATYELYDTPYEYRRATVELGASFGGGMRIFADGGKESAWDRPLDPSLRDTFWEVGFAKRDGDRLSVEIAAGERTFGSSRHASVAITARNNRISLTYSEEPTSRNGTPYNISKGGVDALGDLLSQFEQAERYIANRFAFSWTLDLEAVDITLGAVNDSREQRTRLDGTPLGDEKQSGANVSVSWRLGSRTNLNLHANKLRREFELEAPRYLRDAGLGLDRELGPRTKLSLDYSKREEESTNALAVDYTANTVSVLLSRSF
jgi:hypothetical protein